MGFAPSMPAIVIAASPASITASSGLIAVIRAFLNALGTNWLLMRMPLESVKAQPLPCRKRWLLSGQLL